MPYRKIDVCMYASDNTQRRAAKSMPTLTDFNYEMRLKMWFDTRYKLIE